MTERIWDGIAQNECDQTDEPIDVVRDAVILNWLGRGDTRPFFDWVLLQGHTPSRFVIHFVASMMAKADSPDYLPPDIQSSVDFGLKITGRKRGDRSNLEIEERDNLIARKVHGHIEAGEKYDAAVAMVRDWLSSFGYEIGTQTVRDAYDTRKNSFLR